MYIQCMRYTDLYMYTYTYVQCTCVHVYIIHVHIICKIIVCMVSHVCIMYKDPKLHCVELKSADFFRFYMYMYIHVQVLCYYGCIYMYVHVHVTVQSCMYTMYMYVHCIGTCTCTFSADRRVFTWGRCDYGQLGRSSHVTSHDPTTNHVTCSYTPTEVPELRGVQKIACGSEHNIAITGQHYTLHRNVLYMYMYVYTCVY